MSRRAVWPVDVNVFQQFGQRLAADAQGRLGGIEQEIARRSGERIGAQTQAFVERTPENANDMVAAYLSNAAAANARRSVEGGASPLADAARQRAAQAIGSQLGLDNQGLRQSMNIGDLSGIKADQIAGLMAQQDGAGRAAIGRAMAEAGGAGPLEQLGRMNLAVNQALAEKGRRGDIARAGLVTGIVGGGALGTAALTEGAQQLIALMQYLQSGQQTEERSASSELA